MVPERQRPLVDIAADVMADENQQIGISYTGFCLTSLPHKRLPDEQIWEKKGHRNAARRLPMLDDRRLNRAGGVCCPGRR